MSCDLGATDSCLHLFIQRTLTKISQISDYQQKGHLIDALSLESIQIIKIYFVFTQENYFRKYFLDYISVPSGFLLLLFNGNDTLFSNCHFALWKLILYLSIAARRTEVYYSSISFSHISSEERKTQNCECNTWNKLYGSYLLPFLGFTCLPAVFCQFTG